jgi:hypothetical protein
MSQGGGTADVAAQPSKPGDAAEHDRRIAERLDGTTTQQLAGWLRPAETRLRTVENYIADQRARLPAIERECAAIRQNLTAVRERLERPAA